MACAIHISPRGRKGRCASYSRNSSVTPATQGYRLEIARSHAVLRLEPMMGQAAWGDIDRVGTEVLANVNGQKNGSWLIDLSGLEYMGSALVALVVRVWKAVQTSGGKA